MELRRVFKILVFAVLGLLSVASVVYGFTNKYMRESSAYSEAKSHILKDTLLQSEYGQVEKFSYFVSGSIENQTVVSGNALLYFYILNKKRRKKIC